MDTPGREAELHQGATGRSTARKKRQEETAEETEDPSTQYAVFSRAYELHLLSCQTLPEDTTATAYMGRGAVREMVAGPHIPQNQHFGWNTCQKTRYWQVLRARLRNRVSWMIKEERAKFRGEGPNTDFTFGPFLERRAKHFQSNISEEWPQKAVEELKSIGPYLLEVGTAPILRTKVLEARLAKAMVAIEQ